MLCLDDNGGQQSAVPPIDSLRSGKTPLFAAAAAGNSMWSQKAQSAGKCTYVHIMHALMYVDYIRAYVCVCTYIYMKNFNVTLQIHN